MDFQNSRGMTKKGWIKLFRKIQDHAFWKRKPFSPGQAMIDLLLRATHQPIDKAVGFQTIHLEPGEFFTSLRNLAKDWGWSLKRVRNFLNALKNENFVTARGTEKGTTFHLINWHTYQESGHTKGTRGAHLQEHKEYYIGKHFFVSEEKHQKYNEAYPSLDLIAEYKKMDAWLESNPSKRKTERGYPRFVNSWLSVAAGKTKNNQGNWFDKYPDL